MSRAAIDEREIDVETTGNPLAELVAPLQSDPPSVLYHYTSADAVVGMTCKNEFWLTEHGVLNDPGEFSFGLDRYFGILSGLPGAKGIDLEKVRGFAIRTTSLFVGCMTTASDSISQWRGYGDGGRGYCVGLDPRNLSSYRPSGNGALGPILLEVKYGESLIPDYVKRSSDEIVRMKDTALSEMESSNDVAVFIVKSATLCGMIFKHDMYEEEAEWRVVELRLREHGEKYGLRFRAGAYGIVPYLPVPVWGSEHTPDEVIKSICVGPRADARMERTLQLLCEHEGLHASIERSRIPFV